MIFKKNIDALMQVDPKLVAQLMTIKTNERFEIFVDQKDAANINIYDKTLEVPIYKSVPIDEINSSFNKFKDKYIRYPVIFVYGIGNGVWLKMILELKSIKKCHIFEPNLELIYIALNLFDFSTDILEKRLAIYWETLVDQSVLFSMCSNPEVKVFLKIYEMQIPSNYYTAFYGEKIKKINKQIVKQIKHVITGEGNDANDSLIGVNHHLTNIPKMVKSYTLQSLAEQKNSDFAVIVSTGPSLTKQLPFLKEYKDFITILCIDASLPILQKEGIAPDIVFSLERVEATAKFFENLDRELLKDTIFVPTSISHPKLLKNIEGMKQVISMRPFGYAKMYYFNKWGYIGIGMSAANMAFDFAVLTNYKNIAFIGQDLAFGDGGQTHAKGSIYGEKEEQYEATHKVKGYYGGEVYTTMIWQQFLHYFLRNMSYARYIKKLNIYNCTEGGVHIDGAEHIPFKKFLEKVDRSHKKRKIELEKVSASRSEHYMRRVKKLLCIYLEKLKAMKKRTEETFLEVMNIIEELEKLNREKELDKIDFDKIATVIDKIDMVKEMFETDKAVIRFANITNPLIVNAELELARIMATSSNKELEKKVKMIDWIYEHKSWLFFLAGALENIIFILDKHYNTTYSKVK